MKQVISSQVGGDPFSMRRRQGALRTVLEWKSE